MTTKTTKKKDFNEIAVEIGRIATEGRSVTQTQGPPKHVETNGAADKYSKKKKRTP